MSEIAVTGNQSGGAAPVGLPRALLTEAAFLNHPPAGGGRPPPRGLGR